MVNRILSLAKEKGVKQAFIEEKIGAYRGKITEWKRGNSSPTDSDIRMLAGILGTTESYLRGEIDDPSQNENSPAVLQTAELLRQYFHDKMGRDPTPEEFLFLDRFVDTYIKGLDK